ncbi:hypothetical protein KKE06_03790 [Candidatus Micrarchaeota archaeon]|nr:hypothetical protein [Candidatus Micrarchaeota archaeon]MBU1930370.1 hypothetical protein [Candidatus Micrarchaeota archaeon]
MVSKTGIERFQMVKKRHEKTFEKAVQEKKADAQIIPLCRFLNQQPFFFTASSCSGRIVVLRLDAQETKREAAFFYKKHEKTNAKIVWNKINEKTTDILWFKQEPFILHLGTNSLENANRVLVCARKAGIKRAGIIVAKTGKFLIELIGTHGMAIPVKKNNIILVEKDFFVFLVKQANKKLEINFERLKKFEKIVKKELRNQQ